MNNVEKIYREAQNAQQFAAKYFEYLSQLLKEMDTNAIAGFIEELILARKEDKTVFLVGNGGSAATCSHMANDIGTDVRKKGGSEIPFRILSLTDNNAVMTAIANDDGYDNVFVNQLRIHYRPGDKLVAISASGNSPNLVKAAQWVKERGGRVISMVGFDGGKLREMSDLVLHVKTPKHEYGPVEDIHMILDHLVSNYLMYRVQAEGTNR